VHLLLQMAQSLAEAHDRHLVHRDIKPANVFACRYGSDVDFVKVLDFGLVKSLRLGGEDAKLTAENVVAGTPAFMAPEIVRGAESVDGRADLYALGAVAYWLLTGRLVFEEKSPLQMALAHAHDDPAPPSHGCEQAIPAELEALVMRLLAKDPAERPADAHAVEALLLAVPLERAWTRERRREWWEAHLPAGSGLGDRSEEGTAPELEPEG
jgi:serine/threonine-protein kinase